MNTKNQHQPSQRQFLSNHEILLRQLEPEDVELLYKWENNTLLWQFSNTVVPLSKYNLFEYIKNSGTDIYSTRQLHLIIQKKGLDNRNVGSIELFDFEPFHKRIGVGVMIYEKADRKKHLASQALDLITEYCFYYLNVRQIYCNISEKNTDSLLLFQKKGFEVVGLKKDWLNHAGGFENEYLLQKINTFS